MKNETEKMELIEIVTDSSEKMELGGWGKSMLSVDKAYRSFSTTDNKDNRKNNTKIYVARVEDGSIKLWLAKIKPYGKPLIDFVESFWGSMHDNIDENSKTWTAGELRDRKNWLSNNKDNTVKINIFSIDRSRHVHYNFPPGKTKKCLSVIEKILNEIKSEGASAPREKERIDGDFNAIVIFLGSWEDLKIAILEDNTGNQYPVKISKKAKSYFNRIGRNNIFGKEYRVKMEAVTTTNGEVREYIIENISRKKS